MRHLQSEFLGVTPRIFPHETFRPGFVGELPPKMSVRGDLQYTVEPEVGATCSIGPTEVSDLFPRPRSETICLSNLTGDHPSEKPMPPVTFTGGRVSHYNGSTLALRRKTQRFGTLQEKSNCNHVESSSFTSRCLRRSGVPEVQQLRPITGQGSQPAYSAR